MGKMTVKSRKMDTESAESTKTVLLTLDCGTIDEDSLRALKLLTEDEDVEVTGLYVEDEDLFRAARLPGMAEVSVSGEVTTLNHNHLTAQISREAQRARNQFESFVRNLRLRGSFQIARGRVVETLVNAAANSDYVVVSRSLRTSGLRTRHGSHFEPLIQNQRNLLFVNEPWRSGSSVVVLCESSPGQCERAMTIARRFAADDNLSLLIALPNSNHTATDSAFQQVVMQSWNEDAIVELCASADARLLIVPPTSRLDWRQLLLALVDRLPCSLLRLE